MSLINQMLQDLEKRQPGVLTSTPPPAVLAVPVSARRIHPAWWLVPLLAVAMGLYLWLVGLPSMSKVVPLAPVAAKPPAASPIRVIASPTPLPTEPQTPVAVVPLAASPAPVVVAIPAAAVPAEKTPLPAQDDKPIVVASATLPEPTARAAEPKPRPPAPARPVKPSLAVANMSGDNQAASTPTVTKQLKETTPQQQAENEYRKAVTMVQQGRNKDAIETLNHALQLDPRHTAARQTLVGVLLEARRFGDAERKLQEGLAINPEQPDLVMILARLQVERGDVRGGLASLERALPYAPDHAEYQAFVAALYQREGRHRQAIEHYLLALRNAPQTGVWLMGLGISLQADNRLPEAREAFLRARNTHSLNTELLAFVEQRLKQLGQ